MKLGGAWSTLAKNPEYNFTCYPTVRGVCSFEKRAMPEAWRQAIDVPETAIKSLIKEILLLMEPALLFGIQDASTNDHVP